MEVGDRAAKELDAGKPKEGPGRFGVLKGGGIGLRSCKPEVSPCIIKPKLKPPEVGV